MMRIQASGLYIHRKTKYIIIEKKLLLVMASVMISFCCTDDDNLSTGEVTRNDRDFVIKASMSNYSEIEAGKAAQSMASDDAIRQFGQMMVTDHTAATDQWKELADSLYIAAPDSADSAHVLLLQRLDTLSGSAFDPVYIHSQVEDHQKAVSLFQEEVSGGDNSRLRAFAAGILPRLQQHLSLADSLAQKY